MITDECLRMGDCLEVLKDLQTGSMDMVLCDPPYGTTACKWDSVIPLEPMWEQLKRVCKERAAIVLMASQPFTSTLICSNLKEFKYCWIWDKVTARGHLVAKKTTNGATRRHLRILSKLACLQSTDDRQTF